ncbi:MAG: molybdopterin molybdotransferase MoeA [Marinifilaceae bacterium]|jgi:molybdopterin molybdotransferase|nr:molybdopterin molybdotransferase MoeA [Marinifilaceae bacterium]
MITFHEAIKTVKNVAKKLDAEYKDLSLCLNRILAEDVFADSDMPAFNKSNLDGYAFRNDEIGKKLNIVSISSEDLLGFQIKQEECCHVLKGDILPKGADLVVGKDCVTKEGNTIIVDRKPKKNGVSFKAEDFSQDELILKKGTKLKVHHLAILASAGCTELKVYRRPKIGILSIGSELIHYSKTPNYQQQRDLNSVLMSAQLEKMGLQAELIGIVSDSFDSIKNSIKKMIKTSDILFISGSGAMSESANLDKVIDEIGFNIWFHNVAVKPGKHTLFANLHGKYILATPGNPASTYVQFELLGKALLYKMMGHKYSLPTVRMQIASNFKRKKNDRLGIIPVRFNANNKVVPIKSSGGSKIYAYAKAKGFMFVPRDVDEFTETEYVHVKMI